MGRGVGGSEVRTSRMAERARLGEGRERSFLKVFLGFLKFSYCFLNVKKTGCY